MPNRKETYKIVYIPKHHPYYCMSSNGYILEHRLVMAIHLGRPLITSEMVHHKDNRKRHNWIENLEIMRRKDHELISYYQDAVRIAKLWNERKGDMEKQLKEAGLEEYI